MREIEKEEEENTHAGQRHGSRRQGRDYKVCQYSEGFSGFLWLSHRAPMRWQRRARPWVRPRAVGAAWN